MRTSFCVGLVMLGSLFLPPQLNACRLQAQATLPLGFSYALATVEVKINGVSETFGTRYRRDDPGDA